MNHLPTGILFLLLALLPALLHASAAGNPFSIGRTRLGDDRLWKPVTGEPQEALDAVSKQCVSFMNALMFNRERAVGAAHERHPGLAQKYYTHLFFALETLKVLIAKEEVGAAYLVANKAAIYQADAHFPAINGAINKDLDDKAEALIPMFSDSSMDKMATAQHKFAKVLPFLANKKGDPAMWVGNFFEIAMGLGDILKASDSIPVMSSGDIYKLGHGPRFLEYMYLRADEFVKRPLMDRFGVFKKSLDDVDHFLAGKAVETPEVAAFLKQDRATKGLYTPLLRKMSATSSRDSATASESVDEIMKMFKLEDTPKKKAKRPVTKLPIVEVDTFKDMEQKGGRHSASSSETLSDDEESMDSEIEDPMPSVPKHQYHARDIRYSFLVLGEFIYNRYLVPFTEAYNWNALAEPIWTDIVVDIEDPNCAPIHESLEEIGVSKEFFASAVAFYLNRVDQAHPVGVEMSREAIMAAYRQNELIVAPQYQEGLRSLMRMLHIDGAALDMESHPRTPNLLALSRPKDLEAPWIVNRALDTADFYQTLYDHTIQPILNRLRYRNPEALSRWTMGELEGEDGYIGWTEVEALLYGLRPERNSLCHPAIRPRKVLAYLEIWREHEHWDSFFSVLHAKALSELPRAVKPALMRHRFGGRN